MKYVLEELTHSKLNAFFGDKEKLLLKYFIYKSIFSQPESLPNQTPLPIQIPKEHLEQWFAQALGVEAIGAGSYPIDIFSPDGKWGADIKMLSAELDDNNTLKNKESGETSLAQKFRGAGVNLDSLFNNHKYEQIKNAWLNIYKEKYKKVLKEKNISTIYYFFFIRAELTFYLVGLKINLKNLKNVSINENTKRQQTIVLDNFIDSKLGTTRIYKAKKRLELRLLPAEWEKRNNFIKFSCQLDINNINLREVVTNDTSLSKHFLELANKIILTPITIQ